ncbi:MAG: hypothetical protein ACI932_002646, partial [Paracoccaceae bacterium]
SDAGYLILGRPRSVYREEFVGQMMDK